ncbi:MAG: hypothetical protein ACREKS_05840 [Candidatus Rokuibacteriota bacterium]
MRRRLGGLEVSAIGLEAPIYGEPNADAVGPNPHRGSIAAGAIAGPRYSTAEGHRVEL